MLSTEHAHAPHLIDTEVASGLRRMAVSGQVPPDTAWDALRSWRQLGIARYPTVGMLGRVWELRANLSAYDASYVAPAELLDCALVTADGRMGRAPGIRCAVTVVPR